MEKCNVFIHNHTSSTPLETIQLRSAAAIWALFSSRRFSFLSIHILRYISSIMIQIQHSTIYTKDEQSWSIFPAKVFFDKNDSIAQKSLEESLLVISGLKNFTPCPWWAKHNSLNISSSNGHHHATIIMWKKLDIMWASTKVDKITFVHVDLTETDGQSCTTILSMIIGAPLERLKRANIFDWTGHKTVTMSQLDFYHTRCLNSESVSNLTCPWPRLSVAWLARHNMQKKVGLYVCLSLFL